jgi:hypothetical protein
MARSCKRDIKTLNSIKGREFTDYLSVYQLLNYIRVPWRFLVPYIRKSDIYLARDASVQSLGMCH